jgi:hypothetical protein
MSVASIAVCPPTTLGTPKSVSTSTNTTTSEISSP